jgi:uncharacterized cupin superfamily protein
MEPVNVFDAEYALDGSEPAGYVTAEARVGKLAGGVATTVRAYALGPGQSSCPYHYEYEEEWLLVLEGEVVLRTPDGERGLRSGDLVCFPVGPAGAHKVTNRSDAPARVLMFSSSREPAVAVYPDSDKIGAWAGDDEVMVRRRDAAVDYWDGER